MFGVTDKDIQFGRQCSVIFDNYSTGESTLINDYSKIFDDEGKRLPMLRVGFDFTKSLDENTNWSTGNVKIYGLTLETFNNLGDYLETEVEVQVGYEYSTTRKLSKLFRAVLIDKSYVIESGISVSTFSLQGYYFIANSINDSKKMNTVFPEKTKFLSALGDVVEQTGFDGFTIDLTNINKSFPSYADKFATYVSNLKFPFGKTYYGTPKAVLSKFCENTFSDASTAALYCLVTVLVLTVGSPKSPVSPLRRIEAVPFLKLTSLSVAVSTGLVSCVELNTS